MAVFGLSCIPSADLGAYSDGAEGSAESGEGEPAPSSGVVVPPVDSSAVDGEGGEVAEGGESEAATGEAATGEAVAGEVFAPPPAETGSNAGATTGMNAGPVVEGAGPEEPAPAEPGNPDPEPATAAQFRFVRLVADSAVQGPSTAIAELNVLDGAGAPIDRTAWTAKADSEELVYVGGARAALAIDGVTISMWHTAWFEVDPAPAHPHTLEVDMGQLHEVSGFRYLARQDGILDGRVGAYRFFVSVDGVEWGEPLATGTLVNSDLEQQVLVPGN